MKIYKKGNKAFIHFEDRWYQKEIANWTNFLNKRSLRSTIIPTLRNEYVISSAEVDTITNWDPPMGLQEIWASGVTYMRSKIERMNESKDAGSANFYDRVYEANRPELFFKATPARTVGSGDHVFIRRDSVWNVPEPECTLLISSEGTIEGYTIGNDMSSRSIEGENPLYLPQAKTYERCASIGPCIYLPPSPLSSYTEISMVIEREGTEIFSDKTSLNKMKRSFDELVTFLYRECDFPTGSFLMTGTGIVPSADFTLAVNDVIKISIEGIGTLINTVDRKSSE